jgi:putative transposase
MHCLSQSLGTFDGIDIRVDGALKGKTAITLLRNNRGLEKEPYWGNHFWSRGYSVTTVGMDEEKIRRYVKYQEENERIEENNSKEYGLF